ncbi:MAG: lasso peptide biosynthesis B2 protein [Gemmatimonadales bacterium]
MLRAVRVGVLAALRTPAWLSAARIRELQSAAPGEGAVPAEQSDRALRTSTALLRRLGRLPLSPWRNTCLYRSIAASLALRSLGVPATLHLGVREGRAGIAAHAWVESPGVTSSALPHQGDEEFVALR